MAGPKKAVDSKIALEVTTIKAYDEGGRVDNMDNDNNETPLCLIVTIISKGYADGVIEAAKKAGADGATTLIGRGTGIHEKAKILGVPIEPEKEIVLVLIRQTLAEQVLESIKRAVDLETPGRGLAFVIDVAKAIGITHTLE